MFAHPQKFRGLRRRLPSSSRKMFVRRQVISERRDDAGGFGGFAASMATPSSSSDVWVSMMTASTPASTRTLACSGTGLGVRGGKIAMRFRTPSGRVAEHRQSIAERFPGNAGAGLVDSAQSSA
jgi:hypothetical protein